MKANKDKNRSKKKHSKKTNNKRRKNLHENDEHIFEGLPDDENETENEDIEEDIEEDITFLNQVHEFEAHHKRTKLITVYELIGSPEYIKGDAANLTKEEYNKILDILDTNKIYIHFQHEYPLEERYRFITEEIFSEQIENIKNTNLHITFIYEDYHPMLDDEDEEE